MIRIIQILLLLMAFNFISSKSQELERCKWKNNSGEPCLTIFSAPNTSKISEESLGKRLLPKNK